MPQRATNLVWGLIGLVAVVVLMLLGASLWRAARTGPAWKRRLVAAGLALLAAMGVAVPSCTSDLSQPGAGGQAQPATAPDQSAAASRPAEDADTLQRFQAAWQLAEDTACGFRGLHPFTQAGQKELLDGLGRTKRDLDALAALKRFTPGEAAFLKTELDRFRVQIELTAPDDDRFEPWNWRNPEQTRLVLRRLDAWLPHLKAVAAESNHSNWALRTLGDHGRLLSGCGPANTPPQDYDRLLAAFRAILPFLPRVEVTESNQSSQTRGIFMTPTPAVEASWIGWTEPRDIFTEPPKETLTGLLTRLLKELAWQEKAGNISRAEAGWFRADANVLREFYAEMDRDPVKRAYGYSDAPVTPVWADWPRDERAPLWALMLEAVREANRLSAPVARVLGELLPLDVADSNKSVPARLIYSFGGFSFEMRGG